MCKRNAARCVCGRPLVRSSARSLVRPVAQRPSGIGFGWAGSDLATLNNDDDDDDDDSNNNNQFALMLTPLGVVK